MRTCGFLQLLAQQHHIKFRHAPSSNALQDEEGRRARPTREVSFEAARRVRQECAHPAIVHFYAWLLQGGWHNTWIGLLSMLANHAWTLLLLIGIGARALLCKSLAAQGISPSSAAPMILPLLQATAPMPPSPTMPSSASSGASRSRTSSTWSPCCTR